MKKSIYFTLLIVAFVLLVGIGIVLPLDNSRPVANAAMGTISEQKIMNKVKCFDKDSTYYHYIDIYVREQTGTKKDDTHYYTDSSISLRWAINSHNSGLLLDWDMKVELKFNLYKGNTFYSSKTYTSYYYNDKLYSGDEPSSWDFSGLSAGTYTLKIDTYATRGGNRTTDEPEKEVATFYVNDTTAPTIQYKKPSDTAYSDLSNYYHTNSQRLYIKATDNINMASSNAIQLNGNTVSDGSAITLSAGLNTITAKDYIGNTSTRQIYYDTESPTFSSPTGDDYFITKNSVSISVTDNSSGWSGASISLKYSKSSSSTYPTSATATIGGTSTSFNSEGLYVVTATDKAGNSTTIHFTIDKTKPTLNGVEDGGFYKENVSAKWNESDLKVNSDDSITAKYSISTSGTFPTDAGTNYYSNNSLAAEGNYLLRIQDKAGNYTDYRFTIDKTAPTLTLSGINALSFSNSKVSASWGTTVGGKGAQRMNSSDTLTVLYSRSTTSSYPSSVATSYSLALSDEGNYLIRITDRAGNYTDYRFTIDKTAPSFTLQGLVDGLTYNASKDGFYARWDVSVGNIGSQLVNDNDTLTAYYSRNTEQYPTDANSTYARNTVLSSEGHYLLRLYDAAGNYSEQQCIIDTTAPTVPIIAEYLNYAFNYTASDFSGAVIYYSHDDVPGASASGIVSVDLIEQNFGTWTFYAVDELGNRTSTQTVNLFSRSDFGNLENIKNSYKVSTWFTVSLPSRIFGKTPSLPDIAGNYSFATYDAAMNFAVTKEWEYRVEKLANGWSYVNITNESVSQIYDNRNDLDLAVAKYATSYISDRNTLQLGSNYYPNPTDSNGITRADAITMQSLEYPAMLSEYSNLPLYMIKNDFVFEMPKIGVYGNTRQISIQYIANDISLVESAKEILSYGEKLKTAIINVGITYRQGYYLIEESDRCGNIQRYVVYLDTDTPTLNGEVEYGNGEKQSIAFNNEFIEANADVMLYVSLSMESIFDNIDEFSVVCVSGRGFDDVCFAQGDELPTLSYDNDYFGKYVINVYDRSMNYISFTVRIAGAPATLKHTSLTNETRCSLTIEYDTVNNGITSIELFKVTYLGEYIEKPFDDDGTTVSSATLSYVLRVGGKYVVRFADIFGRIIETDPIFYMKGLPSGSLKGVRENGITKNDVSFEYYDGDGLKLYQYDGTDKTWKECAADTMTLTVKEGYTIAKISASEETSRLYMFFLYVEDDFNLFTEYRFEIDCVAPIAEIIDADGDEIYQESVTQKNFSVKWNEGTARYYSKNDPLGAYSETTYKKGTLITKAGTYVFTITDTVGNVTSFNITLDNFVSYTLDGNYSVLSDGSIISKTNITLTVNERTSIFNCIATNGLNVINGDTLTEDGTYTYSIIDAYGNELSIVIIIDKLPPVPIIIDSDGAAVEMNGSTSKSFTVSCDESDALIFIKNGVQYVPYDGAALDNENVFSFKMTDRMNNACTFTVTIDRTVKYSIKGIYEELDNYRYISRFNLIVNVDELYTGFEVIGGSFMPGEKVSQEGEYSVCIIDAVGNIKTITLIIDKTAPTAIVKTFDGTIISSGKTNKSFTVSCSEPDCMIKVSRASSSSGNVYLGEELTEKGTYYFVISDFIGNESSFTVEIDTDINYVIGGLYKTLSDGTIISKSALTVTVKEDYARFDVDGEFTFNSGETITQEGSYTVTIEDVAGNIRVISLVIDKTAPEFLIRTVSGIKTTANSVINEGFIVTCAENGATIAVSMNGIKYADYDGNILSNSGVYYFIVTDFIGNEVNFTIRIDLDVSFNVRGNYKQVGNIYISRTSLTLDVEDDFRRFEVISDNDTSFVAGETVTKEGHYNITVEDRAGNVVELEFIIDKTAPTIQIQTQEGSIVAQNSTICLPFNVVTYEDGATITVSTNGTKFAEYLGTMLTDENKYYFVVTDFIGNEIDFYITLDNSVLFNIKGTYVIDNESYVSRYGFTLTIKEDYKDFQVVSDNGVTFDVGEFIDREGIYDVTIADVIGNVAVLRLIIDKTAPIITANISAGNVTQNDVSVKIDGAALATYTMTSSADSVPIGADSIFTESGTYTIIASDIAGNESRFKFTIDREVDVRITPNIISGQILSSEVSINFGETVETELKYNGAITKYHSLLKDAGNYELTATDEHGNVFSICWTIIPDAANSYDLIIPNDYAVVCGTLNGAEISVDDLDLSKDGFYSLVFSGKNGEYTLEFMVDSVPPTVEISQEKKQVIFSKADKDNVTYTLYLNGKEVDCAPNDEITERGDYKLIVTDALGNSSEYTFTLNYINNFGIIVIAIAAAFAVFAIVGITVYRKRQKIK